MQRVSVTTQRAHGESAVLDLVLELLQCRRVIEHREFTMRVARIVAGAQFDRANRMALQFGQDIIE
jgi:hypothetical protein